MRFKKLALIILTGVISLSLISCGITSKEKSKVVSQDDIEKQVIEGNNEFGFNIFKELSLEDEGENVFISPLSISTALTMAYNGASGNTKEEMEKVLGHSGVDIDKVNESYKTLTKYLENVDKKVELNIGNSIWIRDGEKINKKFIDTNKDVFGAEVETLDFSKSSAVDSINEWISKSTNGMIKDMLKGPISDDVMMYLINAIYFKGDWQEPFDANSSYTDEFLNSKGEKVSCEFMRKFASGDHKTFYGEGENFQTIKLPYDNGKVSMYVVLPEEDKNINTFVKEISSEKWNLIKNSIGSEKKDIKVTLPKFEIQYGTKELKDSLIKIGMKEAFTHNANFKGIRDEIYISNVVHQAKIEVNEKGSEAAAATIVQADGAAAPIIVNTKEFLANRPFVFIIEDEESGNILFMGTLKNIDK